MPSALALDAAGGERGADWINVEHASCPPGACGTLESEAPGTHSYTLTEHNRFGVRSIGYARWRNWFVIAERVGNSCGAGNISTAVIEGLLCSWRCLWSLVPIGSHKRPETSVPAGPTIMALCELPHTVTGPSGL